MFSEAFKKTPKKLSIFEALLGPLGAPKIALFWLDFSVYFGPRFLVTFTAHFGPHLDPILATKTLQKAVQGANIKPLF